MCIQGRRPTPKLVSFLLSTAVTVTFRKGSGTCAVKQLAKNIRKQKDLWDRLRFCYKSRRILAV